jgi:Lamin Tail Domain
MINVTTGGSKMTERTKRILRARTLVAALTMVSLSLVGLVGTAAAHPVISQVYGGGGNAGATYTHDFVELFNPTTEPISLVGWSIQYATATGTRHFGDDADEITPLNVTLQPGQYLLIQGIKGDGGSTPLPSPISWTERPST